MFDIIFMGTPDFAVPCLDAIFQCGYSLIAVVTQPDRPKGRGRKIMSPSVKKWALQRNIKIYQPEKVKDEGFIGEIRRMSPDLIVTAAFGQILPQDLLDIPRLGCINVHASLLPKYRGASPIQQALLDGETRTGITIMYMDAGMDTGHIILQRSTAIDPEENYGQLHDRLSHMGGQLLKEALKLFEAGKPQGIAQDEKMATYCSRLDKSMGEINWDQEPRRIKNLVRAFNPWPGTYTFVNGKRLKVWRVTEWEYCKDGEYAPGEIVAADPENGIIVSCIGGFVRLEGIQKPGKKAMSDIQFLRGNELPTGTILGI